MNVLNEKKEAQWQWIELHTYVFIDIGMCKSKSVVRNFICINDTKTVEIKITGDTYPPCKHSHTHAQKLVTLNYFELSGINFNLLLERDFYRLHPYSDLYITLNSFALTLFLSAPVWLRCCLIQSLCLVHATCANYIQCRSAHTHTSYGWRVCCACAHSKKTMHLNSNGLVGRKTLVRVFIMHMSCVCCYHSHFFRFVLFFPHAFGAMASVVLHNFTF